MLDFKFRILTIFLKVFNSLWLKKKSFFLFSIIDYLHWMIPQGFLDSILIKAIFFSIHLLILILNIMSRWILLQFLRNLLFHFESFWFDVGHFYSFNFLTVIMRFKFYLCDPLQQLFQDWPSLTSLCLWDLWSPFLSNSFWISLNFCVKSELLIVIVTLISPLNFQSSVFLIFSLITWIYIIFYHCYDLTDANILNIGYLHSTKIIFPTTLLSSSAW